jgi:hypothetical protein
VNYRRSKEASHRKYVDTSNWQSLPAEIEKRRPPQTKQRLPFEQTVLLMQGGGGGNPTVRGGWPSLFR